MTASRFLLLAMVLTAGCAMLGGRGTGTDRSPDAHETGGQTKDSQVTESPAGDARTVTEYSGEKSTQIAVTRADGTRKTTQFQYKDGG